MSAPGPRACPQCGAPLAPAAETSVCPQCAGRFLFASATGDSLSSAVEPWVRWGDYELGRELGRGAVGVVYLARQISLNRPVAVKVLLAARYLDSAARERFLAEAQIVAQLDHPHIVPIHEVGEADGGPFFVMKWIDGESLAEALRRRRQPMAPEAAVRLLRSVAHAVHHAHQRGVLHRDLKPANILLDAQGQPHVTDFGVARRLEREPTATLSDGPVGTPAYMSPEQAAGVRDISVATDVWSLGAIGYELLAGRPPFHGSSVSEMARAVAEAEPPPPSLASGAKSGSARTRDLDTICLKCLQKQSARRYASAQDFADDLGRWLAGDAVLARPSTRRERLERWVRRRPAVAALTALALLLVALGSGGVLWQWRRANRHATAAEEALRQTRDALWLALYDRARAVRTSRQMGQRSLALDAIESAAALRPDPRLREELAAALGLTDLEDAGPWQVLPAGAAHLAVNGTMDRYAFSTTGGDVFVHRFQDGAPVQRLASRGPGAALQFDHAGDLLVVADAAREALWDLRTTNVLLHVPAGRSLTLSPDGARCACRGEGAGVRVLDSQTGTVVSQWEAGDAGLFRFSPRGDLLALERPGAMEIWQIEPPARVAQLALPTPSIGLCWHPTEPRLVFGGEDGQLYFWDPGLERAPDTPPARWVAHRPASLRAVPAHTREGVVPWYHPSGEFIVSTAWDEVLRLWDANTGLPLLETSRGRPLSLSADGRWLAVRDAGRLGRWRVQRPAETRLLNSGSEALAMLRGPQFSPDGALVTAVRVFQDVWMWETRSGRLVWHQDLPGVRQVEFAAANRLHVAVQDRLELWAARDDARPSAGFARLSAWNCPGPFEQAAFAESGRRAVRFVDRVDILTQGAAAASIALAPQPYPAGMAISPDGQWLTVGAWNNQGNFGGELWAWSVAARAPLRKWPFGNANPVFSPDGRWFVAAGVQQYVQFEVRGTPADWPEVRRYERQVSGFSSGAAAFSGDGRLLALQADSRLVRLIAPQSGAELIRLTPAASNVEDLALSPDGHWLAARTQHGLQLWDLRALRAQLRTLDLDWTE